MKKIFILLVGAFLLFFLVAPAHATLIYLDVGTLGYGTGDGQTAAIEKFTLVGAALVEQNDDDSNGIDAGDTFTEDFIFYVDGYQPGMGDEEGLNLTGGYEITGDVMLSGEVYDVAPVGGSGDIIVYYTFDPGSTINYYIDTPDFPQDPYGEVDLTTPSVDKTNYTDGTLIATATVVSGLGQTRIDPAGGEPDEDQGSVNLTIQFTWFHNDLWYEWTTGRDLSDELPPGYYVLSLPGVDVDDTITYLPGGTDPLFWAKVSNEGSQDWNVIPEPTTMLLLGSGLIGLAGVGRRKLFKKG